MGDGVNIAARLEGVCEPGAICLSEDAYRQVKGRLDLAVTDLGPTQLKNIVDPVRVYSLEVGKPAQAKPAASTASSPAKAPSAKRRFGSGPLAAIAALLLLAAAAGWFTFGGRLTKPAQAAHLSVVVLPFANLSGDPAHDYFADGITENLTTELSRIRDKNFVIARNTAFTYKGKGHRLQANRHSRAWRSLCSRRLRAARPEPGARERATRRRGNRRASLGRPFRGGSGRSVQAAKRSRGAIGRQSRLRFDERRSREPAQLVQESGRDRI